MKKVLIALGFIFVALLSAVRADNFPSRPITLIVPFPPGGSTDVAARIMADKMGAALGQPVIVENVGGAGGSIGVGRLARATPDGYTIDIGQWDTHVGSIIYNINFDLRTDFAPIGLISINPMLLVAKKALPADDLKSLVEYIKAHPGDAKFVNQNASAQVGGLAPAETHRHGGIVRALSRCWPGDDRSDLGPGRSPAGAGRGGAAAGARRHDQGAR
jgi:tripartite-type tricarboxylate transporter receptor subunit TctC